MTTYGYPDEETGKIIKPPVVDNLFDNMSSNDLCIIDNGEYIYLYVGRNVNNELIYDIFGYEDFDTLHYYAVSNLEVILIQRISDLTFLINL